MEGPRSIFGIGGAKVGGTSVEGAKFLEGYGPGACPLEMFVISNF